MMDEIYGLMLVICSTCRGTGQLGGPGILLACRRCTETGIKPIPWTELGINQ